MSKSVRRYQSDVHDQASTVFTYGATSLIQCDVSEVFIVSLHFERLRFKLTELIAFRRKIFAVDIPELFNLESPDIELIYLPHLDRHLMLSLHDILQLRELLTGAFAMLQLNSLVHRALYNPIAGQLAY